MTSCYIVFIPLFGLIKLKRAGDNVVKFSLRTGRNVSSLLRLVREGVALLLAPPTYILPLIKPLLKSVAPYFSL